MIKEFLARLKIMLHPPPRPILTVQWNLRMMMHDVYRGSSNAGIFRKIRGTNPRQDISMDVRRPNPLVLKNISHAIAFNVVIEDVVTTEGTLTFSTALPVINPGEEATIDGRYLRREYAQQIDEGIENFFLHQAFQLSDEDWKTTDYLEQEVTVKYNDYRGYLYWTKAMLRYQ